MKEFTAVKELSEKLLEDYKTESSFFFASPTRTILAEGEFTTVKHHEIESFPELVQAVLCNAKQAGNPNLSLSVLCHLIVEKKFNLSYQNIVGFLSVYN